MRVSVLSSPRRRSWLRRILRRFRDRGTHPAGGYLKPSASTSTKERGTRTPATGITEVYSSYYLPGVRLEDVAARILRPSESSFTADTSYGCEITIRGWSGGQLGRADFTNRGDE